MNIKNILFQFQKLFKSTTDLKKKRNVQSSEAGTREKHKLSKMAKIESEERKTVDVSNPYNKDVGTQTNSCSNHLNSKFQRSSKNYSGLKTLIYFNYKLAFYSKKLLDSFLIESFILG